MIILYSISQIFDTAFKYTAPVTLFLFVVKYLLDKRDEKLKKEKEHYNNFDYFDTVIGLILTKSNEQVKFYEDYITKLRNEPTNTQQLTIVINEDLKQVVSGFDRQKYFHSFRKQFKNKDQTKAKEIFLRIYSRLDLCLKLYESVIKTNDSLLSKLMIWDDEHRIIFTQKLKPEIREVQQTLNAVNKDLHDKFAQLLIAYDNSDKRNSDFQIHFCEPLLKEKELYTSTILFKLVDYCSESKAIYVSMKSASIFNAQKIEESTIFLKKILLEIHSLIEEYKILLKK